MLGAEQFLLDDMCSRHSVPLYIAAAQFPLAHPAVTALLFGARTRDELEATIAALRSPVPPSLWDDLRAEGLINPAAPTPQS